MTVDNPKVSQDTWSLCGQLVKDEPDSCIPLEGWPFTIGRRHGSSLTLNCPSVSGQHAELTYLGGRLCIRDLDSTNGTFVNGARIHEPCKLEDGDLIQIALNVFRVKIEGEFFDSKTITKDGAERALSLIQFDKLMTERAVLPHFQPIIELASQRMTGFEVLGRSLLVGLRSPKAMFASAAALSQEAALSRMMRYEGISQSSEIPGKPRLFVNTHPAEMAEPEELITSLEDVRELVPDTPLVLEIHEACVTRLDEMRKLRDALTSLKIDLAYDDFGAGQARLVELVEVPPDYLKFDIALVRGIDLASTERQRMLGNLVQMVRDLGIAALAEGIETAAEHETCQRLGFDFVQGFYYGRPELPGKFSNWQHVVSAKSPGDSI